MIFYSDDWKYYPNAIADVDTKNESFVRYAALLERMNVKNNLFHLSLLDKDLVGVDPHDPDLDIKIIEKIIREVRNNIWYCFREVIKIPTTGSVNNIPYNINRLCGPFHWLYTQCISCFVIGPRQSGKSLCADVQHVTYLDIYCRNTPIDVVVNSSTLRSSSTEKRISLRDTLPKYLTYRTTTGLKRDKENVAQIQDRVLNNLIRCHLATDKLEGAEKLGRGLTGPLRHIDEGPHCKNIHISLGIAEMGGIAAIEKAKEQFTPYGTCITTTPGDITTPEGLYMYNIYTSAMPWTEQLYDCKNRNELQQVITMQTCGKSQMVNITMYHNNLGRDNDWLASEIIRSKATLEDIDKDLLLQWSKGNYSSPLSKDVILRIANNETDPKYTEITSSHYVCRWYCDKDDIDKLISKGTYILSLDPSEMAGGDLHGLTLTNVENMSILMTCAPSEGNTYVFTQYIFDILVKYPNLLFVVEAKSTGRTIIDTLIVLLIKANINPFKRIYHTILEDDKLSEKYNRYLHTIDAKGSIELYTSAKKYFGIPTNKQIRDMLYSQLLVSIATDFGHNIKDRGLGAEIRQLIKINGRIDHPSTGDDDLVISWLLTAYVLRTSMHLRYFNINPSITLRYKYISPNAKIDEIKSKKITYEEEKILELKYNMMKSELVNLINTYKFTNSLTEQDIIEFKIKNILETIQNQNIDINSIGGLVDNIINDSNNRRALYGHRKNQFINNVLTTLGKK